MFLALKRLFRILFFLFFIIVFSLFCAPVFSSVDGAQRSSEHKAYASIQNDTFVGPVPLSEETQSSGQALSPTPGWELFGTCEWQIDGAGCLTIRPANGGLEGSFPAFDIDSEEYKFFPWVMADDIATKVKSVKIVGTVHASNTLRGMFYNCSSLSSPDLSTLDTSEVADMGLMFALCENLESLDLSYLDVSNVLNVEGMFHSDSGLKYLNLSGWSNTNGVNATCMFESCGSLETLDWSGVNEFKVNDMTDMFAGCSSLKSLDLSGLDTSNLTDMSWMFYDFHSVEFVNLSGWDISNVSTTKCMFRNCNRLVSLVWTGLYNTNGVDMSGMFENCKSLESLILLGSSFCKVTNMNNMFDGCGGVESLDISGLDTSEISGHGVNPGSCISLNKVTVGEKSTFLSFLPWRTIWMNSEGNKLYYSSSIPSGVADAYTLYTGDYSPIVITRTGSIVLNVGDIRQLETSIASPPLSAFLEWSSSSDSVASVDSSGRVTAKAAGEVTITAHVLDSYDWFSIRVQNSDTPVVAVESVTLDKESMTLVGQETQKLTASVIPLDATCKGIVWSSSDSNIVRVDAQGSVTAVGKGNATITARSADGAKSASCNVMISNPITWAGFSNIPNKIYVDKEDGVSLSVRGDLAGETDGFTSVVWSTSNRDIAEVSGSGTNILVKGISPGFFSIQASVITNGRTFDLNETVQVDWGLIENITLSETSKTVEVGSRNFALTYGISNPSAAGRLGEIKWSSSNLADIEGSNGVLVVTPKRAGSGTIRFWCEGQSAESLFNLTVMPKRVSVSEGSEIDGYMNVNDAETADLIGDNHLRIMNSEQKESPDLVRLAMNSAGDASTILDAYDIDLVDDSGNVVPWNQPNHTVTVFVKMGNPMKVVAESYNLGVHFVDTQNNKFEVKNAWVDSDNIAFDTTHFSTYAITATPVKTGDAVQGNVPVGSDPKVGGLPNTGDKMPLFLLLALESVLLAVGLLLLVRAKTKRSS